MLLSFWLGWNVTTRRAVIGISSPVLGLRPGRWGLTRSWKIPNPDSLTLSPFWSAVRISSKPTAFFASSHTFATGKLEVSDLLDQPRPGPPQGVQQRLGGHPVVHQHRQ